VARRLAAKVAGSVVEGQTFLIREWNDKYTENDSISTFEPVLITLDLPRVIVLLTEESASASEAFVNGLEPYIDVIVVGGRTEGKAFTSNSREYCGKSINAMRSLRTNALGVSVTGGVMPDCAIEDDWQTQTNDVNDPLVASALSFLSTGTCLPTITNRKRIASGGPSFRAESPAQYRAEDVID